MGGVRKVAVVLSGCGYLDGSEIHEATLTLLSLAKRGLEPVCFAPKGARVAMVDHGTGAAAGEATIDVFEASARIARGKVTDLATADPTALDAVVFPGGFGAAKTLCTFAKDGANMTVRLDVERLIKSMQAAHKPLGFVCIAPVIAAKVLGSIKPRLTVGTDEKTAAIMESFGALHVACGVDEILIDRDHSIVSTPAYMLAPSIAEVARGVDSLVEAVARGR